MEKEPMLTGSGPPQRADRNKLVCTVMLLDGQEEHFAIDKNANGDVLLNKTLDHLNILEKDFFGLTYNDENNIEWWLNREKKITAQLKGKPPSFIFRVKFYPPEPEAQLKEDITKYALCVQIRNDILNSRLPASHMTLALLGAYTVQSELGDFDAGDHGQGVGYIRDIHFAPNQTEELLNKIAELHKTHKGLTPSEADQHFLENAKKLAMYGVDLHTAKDAKNDDIKIGISCTGIRVFHDRLQINRFAWPKIIKISYKRYNFYIKVRPGNEEKFEHVITFKLPNHKLAKRLWRTAVEHHQFFRLKVPESVNTGTLTSGIGMGTRHRPDVPRTLPQTQDAAVAISRPQPEFQRYENQRRSQGKPGSVNSGYATEPRRSKPTDQYDHNAMAGPNYGTYDPNGAGDQGHGRFPGDDPRRHHPNGDYDPDQYDQKRETEVTSPSHRPSHYQATPLVAAMDPDARRLQNRASRDSRQEMEPNPLYADGGAAGYNQQPLDQPHTSGTTERPNDQVEFARKNKQSMCLDYDANAGSTERPGGDPYGLGPNHVVIATTGSTDTSTNVTTTTSKMGGSNVERTVTTTTTVHREKAIVMENQELERLKRLNDFVGGYTTERDGSLETRRDQRLIIHTDGDDVDHDELLAEAIRKVADLNPNLEVEKVEIRTESVSETAC